MSIVIFTLTSARSGTLWLRNIFRRNLPDCVCRHEPFFDWGNPAMFGRAIYDAQAGRIDRIRPLLARKRAYIARQGGTLYLESSHAFLKSAYVAALEFFPDMRLIHLIRDPLKVAKSDAWRQRWRVHAPFHCYTAPDGSRHFVWSLTGKEEIFRHFDGSRLSLFQWCLLQWIEIEHRAMAFLERNQLHHRCFILHCPRDLNDPARLKEMFDFFGLKTARAEIRLGGRKHGNLLRPTRITPRDQLECDAVLQRLPRSYRELFGREPYAHCEWSARFQGPARGPIHATATEPHQEAPAIVKAMAQYPSRP